jgi:hypothetical protein
LKAWQALLRGAVLWGVLLLLGAGGWMTLTALGEHGDTAPAGWGGEALLAVHEDLARLSPIAPANACGLGASSCFKCHNGKRAPAPSLDEQHGIWHLDHQSVNYSCAGCHKGNPRILKQEIAHRKLLGNPLEDTAASCASCHGASQLDAYVDRYQKLLNGDSSQ